MTNSETFPLLLSRWLHEHWEYILRRIDIHKDYEVHIFTEGGDEARKPKEGDTWTAPLYDEIFIPYQVGEAARENYIETSYVNDVNRAYAETLMEYQTEFSGNSSLIGSGGMSGSAVSIYEYGIQRLSYTDTESGELFTYLYDGRGSVSNLTSQSGASVLSCVYDAYGMAAIYNQSNAYDLIKQIYEKLPNSEAVEGKLDVYGQRYTVDIQVTGLNGNTATVRTGWIIRVGSNIPELTTLFC